MTGVSISQSPTGNLSSHLDDILGALGVARAADRDEATATAETVLAERGHAAAVVEIRWGKLVLTADPVTAKLLYYDLDALLATLDRRAPGVVREICVRTHRTA